MIKAVFIDVDDTLLDFDESAKMSMHMAAKEMGVTLPEDIWEIFVDINEVLWKDLEQGNLTNAELFHVRWTKIFEAADIEADGPAFEKAFLSGLSLCAPLIDGADDLVKYLYGKYRLAIASNGPYEQQAARLQKVGLSAYIDHLFVSGKIGHAKPSRAFFDACMKTLGDLKPEEVMMIGDSISADIAGAEAYGMLTCWYNHKGAPPEQGKIADYTVQSLREIKEIL